MVGVMVPISVEGGRKAYQREANTARRSSCTSYVKPLLKKNSRSRLRTFQVSIQVENQDETPKPQLLKRGSTSKLVLPWDPSVVQQICPEVPQARRLSAFKLSSGFTQFQLEALAEHNKYREKHSVHLLELRKELCQSAQQYADRLALTDQFQHSGDPMYGENLYWGWSSQPCWVPRGVEAITSWYSEGADYDYSVEPPPDSPAGHFTQLVWAGSRNMGVGLAAVPARQGKWIVVVKYDPPGNWLGQYTANVWRPCLAETVEEECIDI